MRRLSSISGKCLSDSAPPNAPNPAQWNREHPYSARLAHKRPLTSAAAFKQVLHVEIDLGDSGIHWQPGDTLAIRIENDPALVQEVLDLCGLATDTALARALRQDYELTQVHAGFFKHYAGCNPDTQLLQLAADVRSLRPYMEHRQIVDVLREFPATLTADQLRGCLRNLQQRQYSIASSHRVNPTLVALTIGLLAFDHEGHLRRGAGSGFLAERATTATPLSVHVVSNPNFRLPTDPGTPIIMIGPGTGIAPFRAFLQERASLGQSGRNWLLAGNRRRDEDFLYGDELLAWQRSGLLSRLDTAFSRDQAEKIYVQQLLLLHGGEVFSWLQQGAHLYVCGDARHMAEDVQKALLQVVEQHGSLTPEAARQYLISLRQQQRYQRDVY